MPRNENTNRSQNKEFKLIQKKFAGTNSENNYETEEIYPAKKTTALIKLKNKNKIFKNIHNFPAEEQQLENDNLDFDIR